MSDTNAWQEARIAELEKALEPFARAEAHEDMDFGDDTPLVGILSGGNLTLLDLRRARAVLSQGDRTASVSDQRELET